ncbi:MULTISPECIES: flagellar protein FlgN [Peribacillus]|uniref:flagellar protein FlgN n=1 Tax=Peribacillus TaxID=2675229 RepID=UPI001F4E47FA|nr:MULTISPECIES: flagellar protein FlgN [unclassified Peribacillus]MCK1984987.1 flagellar protein FlgN [Peribacillus sp. Aquil_B1]MCK2009876.1 flagellar protein FlgN [Peribacillus sp. Aquil_B8]
MSARNIIESLQKLIKLHKSFNQLAIRKTAILKANDTEAISALLISEQKHIKAISQTDKERGRAVEEFLAANGTAGQPSSIHTVTELTGQEETEILERLKAELIDEVAKLKERNGLNQQLIYQSLQFINLSLDMLRPQNHNLNYGDSVKKTANIGMGMFDSKA